MMPSGSGAACSDPRMVRSQELFYTGVGWSAGARPETNFMAVSRYGKSEKLQRDEDGHPVPHFLCEYLGTEGHQRRGCPA